MHIDKSMPSRSPSVDWLVPVHSAAEPLGLCDHRRERQGRRSKLLMDYISAAPPINQSTSWLCSGLSLSLSLSLWHIYM